MLIIDGNGMSGRLPSALENVLASFSAASTAS